MIMSKGKEVEKTMDMIEKKVGKSLISLVVPLVLLLNIIFVPGNAVPL